MTVQRAANPGGAGPRPHRPRRDISAPDRADVLTATSCFYCADLRLPREVEHYVPLSRGGTNGRGNLVAACVGCNSDKKAMLVHEWRTLRQAHGLPWPPLASHPNKPVHYKDHCAKCRDDFIRATAPSVANRWPRHHFVLAPFDLNPEGDGYRCWYRCPASHMWSCYYGIDYGYFSDCPCAYCWHHREDDGAKHWPTPPTYDDPSWRDTLPTARTFET